MDDTIRYFQTLYLPDVTVTYAADGTGWREITRDEHGLGEVPVVPVVNRPQLWAPLGASELTDVIPLSDAACKIATDMMVSAEFHATPRRWALGFDEDDFTDAAGNRVSAWQTIAGRIWSTIKNKKDDGVEVGQFPEADLRNFHETLRSLAVMVSTVSGQPLHNLGYSSDNPASADGIRAAEARHVKRAERRIRGFEQAWERVMRLALLVRDGTVPRSARWMETVWADPPSQRSRRKPTPWSSSTKPTASSPDAWRVARSGSLARRSRTWKPKTKRPPNRPNGRRLSTRLSPPRRAHPRPPASQHNPIRPPHAPLPDPADHTPVAPRGSRAVSPRRTAHLSIHTPAAARRPAIPHGSTHR